MPFSTSFQFSFHAFLKCVCVNQKKSQVIFIIKIIIQTFIHHFPFIIQFPFLVLSLLHLFLNILTTFVSSHPPNLFSRFLFSFLYSSSRSSLSCLYAIICFKPLFVALLRHFRIIRKLYNIWSFRLIPLNFFLES